MNKNIIHMKENKAISFSLDTLARAVYITFSNNPIEKTVRKNSSFSLDYDKDGNLVGIEIIRLKHVSATFKKIIKDTEKIFPSSCKKIVENLIPSSL